MESQEELIAGERERKPFGATASLCGLCDFTTSRRFQCHRLCSMSVLLNGKWTELVKRFF